MSVVKARLGRTSGSAGPSDPTALAGVHRILAIAAALGLFVPAVSASASVFASPAAGLLGIVVSAGALVLIGVLIAPNGLGRPERLDLWLLALGTLALVAVAVGRLSQTATYVTDEAAFVQQAAHLLLHGHNPYGTDLRSALRTFGRPEGATFTMSGATVSTLGYPALPLLLALPIVAVTGYAGSVAVADTFALALAMLVMFIALPRHLRPAAVITVPAFTLLPVLALAGVTGTVMLPAMVLVACRWTAVGNSGALGAGGRARAVAFGLAASANQLAWFLGPFLIVGMFICRRRQLGGRVAARLTAGYLGLAALTFLAINGTFIVWDPAAWIHGVLAPLTQHAIPFGQGLVGLTVYGRIGGGALDAYTYGSALLYLALLAAFAVEFDRLGPCCFVLPVLALFTSGRSLSAYWTTLIGVIVVSAMSTPWTREPRHSLPSPSRLRRLALAALFVPAASALAVALLTPAPLQMQILAGRSTRSSPRLSVLVVRVRNASDSRLTPHFQVDTTGLATAFWSVLRGPRSVPPSETAEYVLRAPNLDSMPYRNLPLIVQAVTGAPRTISSTTPEAPQAPPEGMP